MAKLQVRCCTSVQRASCDALRPGLFRHVMHAMHVINDRQSRSLSRGAVAVAMMAYRQITCRGMAGGEKGWRRACRASTQITKHGVSGGP